MRTLRLLILVLLLCLAAPWTSVSAPPDRAAATPVLVAIRAAHHGTFDRVVFEFRGGLPAQRRVGYVPVLLGDGSGEPIPVAGRAVLQVVMVPAEAHDSSGSATAPQRKAFPLPNVVEVVRAGDFEATTTYGIGLARRAAFSVSTLTNPSRVVIDIRAGFPTEQRSVSFFHQKRYVANQPPFFVPMARPVIQGSGVTGVLDRLFAGVTAGEQARGLRLLRSGATGFDWVSVSQRVARVRLTGTCSSGGSTVTVAGEIIPTLRRLPGVDWVKIYDETGSTETPRGQSDSIPECLEP